MNGNKKCTICSGLALVSVGDKRQLCYNCYSNIQGEFLNNNPEKLEFWEIVDSTIVVSELLSEV